MEGEMGDEATSSRTSLLGSGDAVGANLPPLGEHPNSMEDEMEVVEGPVQNLDQFFTRVHACAPVICNRHSKFSFSRLTYPPPPMCRSTTTTSTRVSGPFSLLGLSICGTPHHHGHFAISIDLRASSGRDTGVVLHSTLAFVILFPTFLVTYVDYHTLFSTNDLGQALLPLELSRYRAPPLPAIHDCRFHSAYGPMGRSPRGPVRLHPFVAVCLALFLLFWLLQFFQFLSEVRDKREIKRFYNQALRISDEKIQTMEWHEVVDRLTKVAANRRLVIVKDELTPLGSLCRMRGR